MTIYIQQNPVVDAFSNNIGITTLRTDTAPFQQHTFTTSTLAGSALIVVLYGRTMSNVTGWLLQDNGLNSYTTSFIGPSGGTAYGLGYVNNAASVSNATGYFQVTLLGTGSPTNWGFTVYELQSTGTLATVDVTATGAIGTSATPGSTIFPTKTCTFEFAAACYEWVTSATRPSPFYSLFTGWGSDLNDFHSIPPSGSRAEIGIVTASDTVTISTSTNLLPVSLNITPTKSVGLSLAAYEASTSFSYAGTGGVAFSGDAGLKFGRNYAPSGGITFSGTPVQLHRSINITGTGGILFSGNTITKVQRYYLASGGIVLSGSYTAVFHKKYNSSGGIALSGSSTYSRKYLYAASGGILFNGSAAIRIPRTYTGNGGITFSGFAVTNGPSVLGLGPIPYQPGDTRWAPNVGRK